MKCIICGNGETRPGMTMVTFDDRERIVVVKDVPAEICQNCGEAYVDESVTEAIMETTDKMPKVSARVDVRKYTPL